MIGVLIAALLMVCCVAGVASVGGLLYFGYRLDKDDTITAMETYLDRLKVRNYGAAYDQLCDEAKSAISRDQFQQRSFDQPRLVSYEIKNVTTANLNGHSGYTVDVEARLENGQTRTDTYFVFNENADANRYYICPPGT
jgi:hypothetical protein